MKFSEREGHVSERSIENMFDAMPAKQKNIEKEEREREKTKK